MRVKSIAVTDFKRFADLRIEGLPESARIVILAGPNGFGKSSLFDALVSAYNQYSGRGTFWDLHYHGRTPESKPLNNVQVRFHTPVTSLGRQNAHFFYFRTAYRHDPDVALTAFQRVGPATEEHRFQRMNQNDVAVSTNLNRIVGMIVDDLANREPGETTFESYRGRMFGEIDEAINSLIPDLHFIGFTDPMQDATFYFSRGTSKRFRYTNLSGGEKAAFDLILDLVVKRREYHDTIYCIDEPELHMNPALHGKLLGVLLKLTPKNSQLWLATHSIGMMRRAIGIERKQPGSVAFIDFGSRNFDEPVTLEPLKPSRTFWINSLRVALDDLADLVAPDTIIVCEGSAAGKNADHDASCYNQIFSQEHPSVQFISGGNSTDVRSDRLEFVRALPSIIKGVRMRRLIDRDDHSPGDVARMRAEGVAVLDRRTIESYLWDDEVLKALCAKEGRESDLSAILRLKSAAQKKAFNAAPDDVKAAAGFLYTDIKTRLSLSGVGNDTRSFERETLAPLLRPGMTVYDDLKRTIFSPDDI
ncbi:MAG: AAA family ATPase [Vulcanimicrobiaceae bacterium]